MRVFDQTGNRDGFLIFFAPLKTYFKKKKSHHVSRLTIDSGKNMKNFDFGGIFEANFAKTIMVKNAEFGENFQGTYFTEK